MKYSKELIESVNKYNDKLESIAQRILNLKIDFNEKDIEVRNLYGLREKCQLSTIQSPEKKWRNFLKM